MNPPVHNGMSGMLNCRAQMSYTSLLHERFLLFRQSRFLLQSKPIDYSISNIVVMDTVAGFDGVDIAVEFLKMIADSGVESVKLPLRSPSCPVWSG